MSAFGLLQGRERQEIQVYHQQLGDKARRSRFDLQIQVDYRADIQKTETKLSTALLLLGNGKRDKDTGLVTLIAHLLLNVVRVLSGEQKGVFNHRGIGADTLD